MLVFLDLETTGLDASEDKILEVAVIVTDDQLKEVARFEAVTDEARHIRFVDEVGKKWPDPYVRKMHHENGLWGASIASTQSLYAVKIALAAFIREHAVRTEERPDHPNFGKPILPQLAGNTVSFDRGFIERHMPEVAKLIHYRHLDVTSVNELARRAWAPIYSARPNNQEAAHRAMADIEESLRVARYYAQALDPSGDATALKIVAWAYSRSYDPTDSNAYDDLLTAIQRGDWK